MLYCIILLALHCNGQRLWDNAIEDSKIEGIIRKVHIIYRNGHREPKNCYPRDPHIDAEIWTNGPGHLTNLGRQQAFNLGENLRSRYLYLLPDERAWKAISSFSSFVPRTLMTSAVVLAGLIPPSDADRWSSIDWQPALTYPNEILSSHPRCPKLEYLLKTHCYKPSDGDDTNRLYNYVSENSGLSVTNPTVLLNVYSCLETQRQAGLALPIWTYSVFKGMKKEAAKSFHLTSVDILRLQLGPLMKNIFCFNTTSTVHRPIRLYCTHSTIIGGLLATLKFNISEPPNFASTIVIEYREVRGKIHAQLWYRNGPKSELVRLPWPGCGVRCPLAKLQEVLKPFIHDDWFSECMMPQDKQWSSFHCVLAIVIMIVVACGFTLNGYGSCWIMNMQAPCFLKVPTLNINYE